MKRTTSFFRKGCWLAIPAFFVALVSGCGPAGVPVVHITGKVTFNSAPVDQAVIRFVPTDLTTGREAVGRTNENGEFLVLTQGATKDGCLPGSYRITVSKRIEVDARGNLIVRSNEPPPPYVPAGLMRSRGHGPPPGPATKSVLPDKYGNVETSGLTAEVTRRKRNNHFVFELTE